MKLLKPLAASYISGCELLQIIQPKGIREELHTYNAAKNSDTF